MNSNQQKVNIITECIEGNRSAQKQLYDLYKVKMYTLCLRYMSSKMDAEDMLQEGWVRVFEKLDTYNEAKGTFYGWIRKVFVNTNLEHLRKRRMIFEDLNNSSASATSGENGAIDDMSMQELVVLLQGLPAGYRSVFNMYVIEGYAHREIAEMLDISVSTSKTQLMKAKAMMQKKVLQLQLAV